MGGMAINCLLESLIDEDIKRYDRHPKKVAVNNFYKKWQ